MSLSTRVRLRPMRLMMALASLALASCATPPPTEPGGGKAGLASWAGRPIGAPPVPNPALKRTILARAEQEWTYFGRQLVILKGSEESIPHVGDWEDDGPRQSRRVNLYWRAVGKPGLDGIDCQKPWSAAFISWIMRSSGVPESQFRSDSAHWVYLASLIDEVSLPGRYFIPRRLADYSPEPGDLVCASRGIARVATVNGYTTASMLHGVSAHCDLVVAKTGRTLEVVGGNVRNSVSKSRLELDANGRLQPVPRRPWFIILQNRL
ncbi:DUF2272 domain-containing protein [Thiocystis violacea]|uniref:DUF2272 domain-containing protein n=1 Tax=Thiocystis violacea TaxID=13725 RepID=UPI0019044E38|nr:DUF2272 domain-containing protein [Thiocystis violacea]MBK1716605.1 hypothetical protein [Thiocystis violacea]